MNNKLKRKKNTQKNEPIMLFAVWRYCIIVATRSNFISILGTLLNDGFAKYLYNNKHYSSFPGKLCRNDIKGYRVFSLHIKILPWRRSEYDCNNDNDSNIAMDRGLNVFANQKPIICKFWSLLCLHSMHYMRIE